MSIITSPELFKNMTRVPGPDSKEYKAFWKEERHKVKQGITIGGVYIPGWLYWHINHWSIDIDMPPDPVTGAIERFEGKPMLRDNEWAISLAMHEAEKTHKGLLIFGSRQLGKSEFGASYMARRTLAFKNTQNVLAGLSESDFLLLVAKLKRGYGRLHKYFKPQFIKQDWEKEVIIGSKTVSGEPIPFSTILIRNLAAGKNTENLAGPTTSSLLLDECGKGEFLKAWRAAKPSLETPYGWRCSPIFLGTSGNFSKGEDAKSLYETIKARPEVYNFLTVEIKDKDNKTIHFIPGYRSSKVTREEMPLSKYVGQGNGTELDQTMIHVVTDYDKAITEIDREIEGLQKAGKITEAKKETMYYPKTEKELFLVDDTGSTFADIKPLAEEHLEYLNSIDYPEEYGWMQKTSDGVKFVAAGKYEKPISTFPTDPDEDKNAPIIIWDHPLPGQEFGILHVAGSDPYNHDESFYSPSLGTIYIFRRTYDPVNGRHQQEFVAAYAARPKVIKDWYDQVRWLMEYYNCTCFPENESKEFISHFDTRNMIHWLEDGLDLAREINPNTKVKRNKGLSASAANINYGNNILKEYCLEELVIGQDKDGNPIKKFGIIRIKDKMLLKEIIAHTDGANVDRIVAARHALIIARVKDKFHSPKPPPKAEEQRRIPKKQSPFVMKIPGGAFRTGRNPFNKR